MDDIDQIWVKYRTNLKRFLNSKISNPADVDDLLQDIFIKTYKNIHTIKSEKNFKAWFFQIANHAIIDFYRKQGRSNEVNSDDFWFFKEDPDIQESLIKCIQPFINSLPKEDADLLNFIDIQGQSQKEFAKINGISYSTLKSRVQKSRKKLRLLYEDCCHFSFDSFGNVSEFEPKSDQWKKC